MPTSTDINQDTPKVFNDNRHMELQRTWNQTGTTNNDGFGSNIAVSTIPRTWRTNLKQMSNNTHTHTHRDSSEGKSTHFLAPLEALAWYPDCPILLKMWGTPLLCMVQVDASEPAPSTIQYSTLFPVLLVLLNWTIIIYTASSHANNTWPSLSAWDFHNINL
jgi:hypothetical protein